MANDPSTLDDNGKLQPSPPCSPCDGLFILGEPRAYTLNKGEYTLFSIGEQLAATYEFCADDGEVAIWQWAGEQWTPAGRLNNSFAVLALDAPGFVAATALTETALLTASPVAPPRLVVDRVFESFNDGETVAPVCVLPGSHLMLLAEAIGFTEDRPIPNEEFVELKFFDADQMDGDGIELPASIVKPEDLEVEQLGDRRVISFQVPPNVGPAFGRLTVTWGDLFFDGLDFEISTQDFFETRAQLTDLVSGAVSELFQTPPALIGGYRPLPAGAELSNGLNLEQIRTVEDDNRWLFFAFDHQARFEQPEAVWILANAATQELELITGENAWPAVYQLDPDVPDDGLIARGSRVGLDFGSPDNQLNQLAVGQRCCDTHGLYL